MAVSVTDPFNKFFGEHRLTRVRPDNYYCTEGPEDLKGDWKSPNSLCFGKNHAKVPGRS